MNHKHRRVYVQIAGILSVAVATAMGSAIIVLAANTNSTGTRTGWVAQTDAQAAGPVTLPGRFEAEDYRDGGEGVGYSDASTMNLGGEYRNDGVDIQTANDTSGSYNIAWIGAGEWLAYDVTVVATGDYIFRARVASIYDCRSIQRFHIQLDGIDMTGPIAVPNTGGWQHWDNAVSRTVSIPAGNYTLKIVAETAGFNLNYVEMSKAPSPATEAIALPGQFKAEDYRAGGPGVGHHDTTEGNHCGAYRGDDVDIQICDDGQEPCYNVGWIRENEWLAYDVRVETTGSYTIILRAATIHNDRGLRIELDGTNVTGSISLPNTGDWHEWIDVTSGPVTLAAGSYTLKVVAETGGFNLNHIGVLAEEEASINAGSHASITYLFIDESR